MSESIANANKTSSDVLQNDILISYLVDVVDMAKKTAAVTARVDPEIKEKAEAILSLLGLSASTAVDMFYRQVIMTGGIPFKVVTHGAIPCVEDYTQDEIKAILREKVGSINKDEYTEFRGFAEGSEDE